MPAAPSHADPHHHVHAHAPHDGEAHSHTHPHGHPHHHSHPPGERHPVARPGFSLLRLSATQRLAIALPLAALLWALALAVIWNGVA